MERLRDGLEIIEDAVAPGLRVGRGLERLRDGLEIIEDAVAPGLRVGRGLERLLARVVRR